MCVLHSADEPFSLMVLSPSLDSSRKHFKWTSKSNQKPIF